jgi:hypothetical protein
VRRPRLDRAVAAILAIWCVVALFSMIDLQFGQRDYYSITALDFSVRTAFTHSIATAGIPPRNPFYFPGQPQPVRYHYFWLILCAIVERAAGGLVGARNAWAGGVFWSGVGLMAAVALALRLLLYRGPETIRRRTLTGIALLAVTGLDILPAIVSWILKANGMERAVRASIDWWNEQVDGFVSTALWEAHYLAGVVVCITALILLLEGAKQSTWAARMRYALVAGVALASAMGVAIYVAFVLGAFLGVWIVVSACKRWWADVASCLVAGATSLVCAIPYLLTLRAPMGSTASGTGPPLSFQVRPFSPAIVLLEAARISGWKSVVANLALLPANYFLELGFFLVAGRIWWTMRKRPLPRAQLALAWLFVITMSICTFVRSSVISNNDLGWRGILLAQFVLLLLAVDVVTGGAGPVRLELRKFLAGLAVLGLLGTIYDIGMLRLYPRLADRGAVATLGWMSRDHNLGERNFAQRQAYEWLQQNTPQEARLQYNPHVSLQETAAFLYSQRQIVAANLDCLAAFGGDSSLCPSMLASLDRLYTARGEPAPASIREACRSLPVDVFMAKDTDAVWQDRQSWVWREQPAFENRFVRMFQCVR